MVDLFKNRHISDNFRINYRVKSRYNRNLTFFFGLGVSQTSDLRLELFNPALGPKGPRVV